MLPIEVVLRVPAGNGVRHLQVVRARVSAVPLGRHRDLPCQEEWCRGNLPTPGLQLRRARRSPLASGDVCVKEPTFALGRSGSDPDPKGDPEERLLWYADRLSEWLRRAASGTLIATGDPFELPQFRESVERTIGWWEDEDSFGRWQGVEDQAGIAGAYR